MIITLIIIALWAVNAWHDSDYYNKKDSHVSGAVFACMIIALSIFSAGLDLRGFNEIFNYIFLLLSLRWIVFDITYNLFIGQKWYYVGSTAFLDKYIPNFIQFAIKLTTLFFDILIIKSL